MFFFNEMGSEIFFPHPNESSHIWLLVMLVGGWGSKISPCLEFIAELFTTPRITRLDPTLEPWPQSHSSSFTQLWSIYNVKCWVFMGNKNGTRLGLCSLEHKGWFWFVSSTPGWNPRFPAYHPAAKPYIQTDCVSLQWTGQEKRGK